MLLERGRAGDSAVAEVIKVRCFDEFGLTPEGWRIALRRGVIES